MTARRIIGVVALLAAVAWLWLCGRALSGQEGYGAARWRTALFVGMIVAGGVAFPRKR
jgi:hypothetical protein